MRQFPPSANLGGGWTLVEAAYCFPGHDAIYIAVDAGAALVFDAGIGASTPLVLAALAELGVAPAAVEWLVISHSHLDHCAGAGQLMRALPNARLGCHARAAGHLAAPKLLIAGARALYGERFDPLYGAVQEVDARRIATLTDGDTLTLGARTLDVLHTPGHTFDSLSLVDRTADCAVVGDAFGVRLATDFGLPELARVPAAPTQFAPREWIASVRLLAGLGVARMLVTHYGEVTAIAARATELEDEIEAFVAFARATRGADDAPAALRALIARRWGKLLGVAHDEFLIDIDLMLSASGLALWQAKHLDRYTNG